MSVSDDAQRLISHATEYNQQAHAVSNSAGEQIGRAQEALAEVSLKTGDSIATITNLLGYSHASVPSLAGLGEVVKQRVEEAQASALLAINSLIAVNESIAMYANTAIAVGHTILQGNG